MAHTLYTLLEPLGLYKLRQNSLIDAELAAYAAALSILEESLEEIRSQTFVQTAHGEGLLRHEKLVGLQERAGVSLAARRQLVIYRLSTSPFDFHLQGMINSVRAAGMDAEIVENYGEESLTVISKRLIDEFTDLDAVKASLDTMLPAHLKAEYDIGVMTWDMFDALDPDWDLWDSEDFTWSYFDMDGHNLFAGGDGGNAKQ